jgi:hypothetical protein
MARKSRSVLRPFPLKDKLVFVLDHAVKPILIIALCVAGLIFEFLVEFPFIVIMGLHRRFGSRGS